MGIIIIGPATKPKSAEPLTDEQWVATWNYCCTHIQASIRMEERKATPDPFTAQAMAFAAFVVGVVVGGMGAIAAIFTG